MIDKIYNKDVLRLAANITRTKALTKYDIKIASRSPLCGSTIEVTLQIKNKKIVDYGQVVKACALGQASASVVANNIIGKSSSDLTLVKEELEAMLKNQGPPPPGDWSPLCALQPAKDAQPRHGAILLPFTTVLKGMDKNY